MAVGRELEVIKHADTHVPRVEEIVCLAIWHEDAYESWVFPSVPWWLLNNPSYLHTRSQNIEKALGYYNSPRFSISGKPVELNDCHNVHEARWYNEQCKLLLFVVNETCYRYQPKLSRENADIADWLIRLTNKQRNWGFSLTYLYLRSVKGFGWNHKRVYRTYCELALHCRIKPKQRLIRVKPEPLHSFTDQRMRVNGLHTRPTWRR